MRYGIFVWLHAGDGEPVGVDTRRSRPSALKFARLLARNPGVSAIGIRDNEAREWMPSPMELGRVGKRPLTDAPIRLLSEGERTRVTMKGSRLIRVEVIGTSEGVREGLNSLLSSIDCS